MNKKLIIITGAGVIIGVAEALVYYNLGKSEKGDFSYDIPKGKELVQTISVVLITSLLTAALANGLERVIPEDQIITT